MLSSMLETEYRALLEQFGEACTLTTTHIAYEIKAIFDNADQEIALSLGITAGSPYMEYWYQDAPAIDENTTVIADGITYAIRERHHDRTAGVMECGLRRVS